MPLRIVLSLVVGVSALLASAQAADRPVQKAKPGPKAEEFYRLDGELKTLVAGLANLQIKYRKATEDQQADIQKQWKDLVAKAEKLQPKVIDAAEKAYAEAPNADKRITDFLVVEQLVRMVRRDDYEPAARIGKLLMENKCDDPRVPFFAGVATFAVSDYGPAERYLKRAVELGQKQSTGSEFLDSLLGIFLRNPTAFKQAWAKEQEIRHKEAKADNLPRVLLKTSKGNIELELFEDQAPNTVANFISLVESGYYKDVKFHRVLPGFMIQGGDPQGTGQGGPGYTIADECHRADFRRHFRGVLSMAKTAQPDSGGSQFFLTFVPTVHLDGQHTVFGRVVSGMEVLAKIQRFDPEKDANSGIRQDSILEAKVLRKRPHQYKPEKMPE
ncbi:MAG: peptidylprolyl isomerase [Thermoguttaceae bacterium]